MTESRNWNKSFAVRAFLYRLFRSCQTYNMNGSDWFFFFELVGLMKFIEINTFLVYSKLSFSAMRRLKSGEISSVKKASSFASNTSEIAF